ncbi:MAG: citrate lyase subunit alpha [Thermoplasmata archaeon]|nr:MAG: citrate lyase subunit alpha [Thermoplasmata archaeon]
MEFSENASGRKVPLDLDGRRLRPYEGKLAQPMYPSLQKKVHMSSGPKLTGSLEEAIKYVGLSDGMTVSFHHCLRNGDDVMNMVMDIIAGMGIRDIRMAQSALFPKQEPLIEHINNGVITRIEGSMNGPVGAEVSKGVLKAPAVLRTHGGRARAIETGELKIDVAFLSASQADEYGNFTGIVGKSAFGPMGFAFADAWYADNVVVITDNLVSYPSLPISIQECYVDHVVNIDSIGSPEGIASGTTKVTTDPDRLRIAEQVVDIIELSGLLKEGFSFQAGAGGTSLAVVKYLHDRMKDKGIVGSFAVGGVTELVTDMLHDGTIKAIIDAQAFDLAAVESLRDDANHVEVSHYHLMNPHTRGCVVSHQDVCFLGATEVDVNFNVNVNTHSNGILLHGTGGHSDAASGSRICFIVAPVYRKTNPIVRDSVTTITTPGSDVDVIVTDSGIAINPIRKDLIEKVESSKLPLKTVEELRDMAYEATGGPQDLELTEDIIALIEYRDGTILDTVWKVKE